MPKAPTQTATKQPKSHKTAVEQKPRTIARPAYKSFRLSKRLRHPRPRVTGSFRLFKLSLQNIMKRKRLFGGITIIYLMLTIVLVKGFGVGTDIASLKDAITQIFGGSFSGLTTSLALYGVLLTNVNTGGGQQSGAYQTVFLIIASLAVIWALRQTLSPTNKKVKLQVRDAFYKGMYPLIPFLLVLAVVGIQLLPVAVAGFLYSTVVAGGLAVTAIEKAIWAMLVAGIILLSLYMITSSVFALYIVTLPEIRPIQALRSARDLVLHRRWTIMRKLLFLPVALLVCSAAITIPLIIFAPTLAEWVFFVLSMFGLVVFHSYLYTLYRELL